MPPPQPPIVAPEAHSDEPLALGPDEARQAALDEDLRLRPATSLDDTVIRAAPLKGATPPSPAELPPPTIRG
jgi:hypothetical protein